ncbi:MAG TPA: hypothetical protein VHB21_24230 [Minicystis sp.]|nr:hypothetical protein [Minicystis sp.]
MRTRAPGRRARARAVMAAGAAVVFATAVARRAEGDGVDLVGAGASPPGAVLDRAVDEGAVVVPIAAALAASGRLHDPEAARVPALLAAEYARMRASAGTVPAPFVATYAGFQQPGAFDLLEVGAGAEEPRGALVFLHGYGGSFALPCWEVAQAARQARLATYCPSIGPSGAWWTRDGEATVQKTLAAVRARGIDRVWLAGLSNGAIGASRLAPKLRGQIRGLVLVSGAAPDARAPGVPTLVVQGKRDTMSPPSLAQGYARRTAARYVELDAGHFALLSQRDAALSAIAGFLHDEVR